MVRQRTIIQQEKERKKKKEQVRESQQYRSNKILIYPGRVSRGRHVFLSVLILAIRKGLNHGAEARQRLRHSGEHNLRTTLRSLPPSACSSSLGLAVSVSRVVGFRHEATLLHRRSPSACARGVVCHSQVLAKYARPFVSDLLFWQPRYSMLAANRIKRFCAWCFPLRRISSISPYAFRQVACASAHVSYDDRRNCENLSRRLSLPEREHQFSGIFVHRIFLLFTATWLPAVVAQQTRPCWTEFRVTSPEKLLLSRVVSLIETRVYPSRSQGTTFVRF